MIADLALARRAERLEEAVWRDAIAATPPALTRQLGLRAEPVADGVALIASEVPTLLYNRVFGFGLDRAVTEAEVDTAIALYDRRVPFSIQPVPFARPGEVHAWLNRRDLPSHFEWVRWVRATGVSGAATTALRIEPIAKDQAPRFAQLAAAIFASEPPMIGSWFVHTVGREGWTHYIGWDGDQAVAIGALFVRDGMGWLGWGGTIESHRGRGGQSAMIVRRIADARIHGCDWVTSETADDLPDHPNPSFRNMERIGFRLLYRRSSHAYFPPGQTPADT
jgi:hypothetical protein